MNRKELDELLARLAATPDPAGEFDLERGRQRLLEGLRRLDDDPAEAQRILDITEVLEAEEDAYQAGCEAIARDDFKDAERWLRRVAEHGNDEAAYRLGLLLQLRCLRLRLTDQHRDADAVAAEAAWWSAQARASGMTKALEAWEPHGTGLHETEQALDPVPPRPRSPRKTRGRVPTGAEHPAGSGQGEVRATAQPQRPTGGGQMLHAVGVELRSGHFTAVLTDQHGRQLADLQKSLPDMEVVTVVGWVAAAVEQLLQDGLGHNVQRDRVALGLQLGGPVDARTGTVLFLSKNPPHEDESHTFRWPPRVPLGSLLLQATGLVSVVENDTNTFAIWEQWFGVGRQTGDFAVMLIREGIGGSVVRDGHLFTGPVEIGHLITSVGGNRMSDADQYGALEVIGGTTGTIAAVGEQAGREVTSIEAAAALADKDSPIRHDAEAAFTAAGVAIANGIGALINFAGPTHVVLYGPAVMVQHPGGAANAFLREVRGFHDFAHEAVRQCELVLRPLMPHDGAHGAALVALERCFQIQPTAEPVNRGSTG